MFRIEAFAEIIQDLSYFETYHLELTLTLQISIEQEG